MVPPVRCIVQIMKGLDTVPSRAAPRRGWCRRLRGAGSTVAAESKVEALPQAPPKAEPLETLPLASIHDHIEFWRGFRIILMDAQRRNVSAFRLRRSQSLARRRRRLSQAMVRSTIQRLGSTTNRTVSQR